MYKHVQIEKRIIFTVWPFFQIKLEYKHAGFSGSRIKLHAKQENPEIIILTQAARARTNNKINPYGYISSTVFRIPTRPTDFTLG